MTSEESYLEHFIKHLFSLDMKHISTFLQSAPTSRGLMLSFIMKY